MVQLHLEYKVQCKMAQHFAEQTFTMYINKKTLNLLVTILLYKYVNYRK